MVTNRTEVTLVPNETAVVLVHNSSNNCTKDNRDNKGK